MRSALAGKVSINPPPGPVRVMTPARTSVVVSACAPAVVMLIFVGFSVIFVYLVKVKSAARWLVNQTNGAALGERLCETVAARSDPTAPVYLSSTQNRHGLHFLIHGGEVAHHRFDASTGPHGVGNFLKKLRTTEATQVSEFDTGPRHGAGIEAHCPCAGERREASSRAAGVVIRIVDPIRVLVEPGIRLNPLRGAALRVGVAAFDADLISYGVLKITRGCDVTGAERDLDFATEHDRLSGRIALARQNLRAVHDAL